MLIFACANAEKKRAAIPFACFIPSPTTEIIDRSSITSTESKSLPCSSLANSLSNAAFATATSLLGTQKLMLYSEEDWVIKITDTPAFDMQENTRAAMPTIPCIPGPETLNIATLSKLVIPLTCSPSSVFSLLLITEPGAVGLAVFLIRQGILVCTNGPIVRG